MSVKCFQAKVVCDSPEKCKALWEHHCLFNEAVRKMLRILFKMKRGGWGDPPVASLFQELAQCLYRGKRGRSQRAHAPIEAVTNPDALCKPTTSKASWSQVANKIKAAGIPLFDAEKEFPYPFWFRRKVYQSAAARFKNYHANLEQWKKTRRTWMRKKEQWERKHPDFMEHVKPIFDAFEAKKGRLAASRRRWPEYLEFLSTDPDLAKRCGPQGFIVSLSPEEASNPYPGERFDAFVKKNCGICALDKLDFEWRVKKKFGTPPKPSTWTEPHAMKHPEFFSYQRMEAYKPGNLDLPAGQIELGFCTAANQGPKSKDVQNLTIRFACDSRLSKMLTTEPGICNYTEPITGTVCKAVVQGIKLVFRNRHGDPRNSQNWDPYLYFSVDIEPLRAVPDFKSNPIPDGTRVMAIDYGQRHFATCSVYEYKNGVPSKLVAVFMIRIRGLDVEAIETHDHSLRMRIKKMFKNQSRPNCPRHARRGGMTFRQFRDHIRHMKEDLCKKGTSRVLKAALKHGVSLILVEDLTNYRPDLKRPSPQNRRIMTWKIRHSIKFLQEAAKPLGIAVEEVEPAHSSQVCSVCGEPGARFTHPTKAEWERYYTRKHDGERRPLVWRGGEFFICSNPHCSRPGSYKDDPGNRKKGKGIVHADVNASLNLHRIRAGTPMPDVDREKMHKVCQPLLDKAFVTKGSPQQARVPF